MRPEITQAREAAAGQFAGAARCLASADNGLVDLRNTLPPHAKRQRAIISAIRGVLASIDLEPLRLNVDALLASADAERGE